MSSDFADATPSVIVEYKNKKPLDLLELTASLTAFGEQYRRYSARQASEQSGARLHIGRLNTGSVIAELIPIAQAGDWLLHHASMVAPFVASYGDTLNLIRHFPPKARDLEKADVRGAKTFLGPVARDPGAEVNIYAQQGSTVVTNVYNFGTNGAKQIRKNADIILGGLPDEQDFEAVPMVLFQMRDGPAGTAGDYGIIDRFSRAPVKIRWASEDVKAAVMGRPENVFDLVYFVTGTAQTAGGRVAVYNVRRLDETALRPPEDRHI